MGCSARNISWSLVLSASRNTTNNYMDVVSLRMDTPLFPNFTAGPPAPLADI